MYSYKGLVFVSELTSKAVIASLKRFLVCYGKNSVIYSDNSSNFVEATAAQKHLRKLVRGEEISSHSASENFVPPRVPGLGAFGIWVWRPLNII